MPIRKSKEKAYLFGWASRSYRVVFSSPAKDATHAVFQLMVANIDLTGEEDEIVKAKDLTIPIDQDFKPLKLTIPLNLRAIRQCL